MALNLFPNLNPAMRQKAQGEYASGFLKGTVDATYGEIDRIALWKHGVQLAEDVIFDDFVDGKVELNFLDGYYDAVSTVFKNSGNDEKLAEVESLVMDGRKNVMSEQPTT